ncbi:Flap endonuclease GEN-like 1 [Linum grandiflorum]
MGVAGKFWDLLKPYARHEDPDFLRDKKVAVDLSYWIVQHDTAIKTYSLNPHLRLTFFRTLNLFSKFGAFPVFVADGTPSPLKSQARIARFFRSSGIDASQWPVAEEAKGEAEALCAQLNLDGHVDACITADSDAFLFGAQLREIGSGSVPKVLNSPMLSPGDNSSPKSRVSHCSVCGHPGSKRAHGKSSCEYCPDGCVKKPGGFRCSCTCCDMERKEKEQKKHENWLMKVCDKISREPNFPNDKIIEMYLCKENGNFSGDDPCISWQNPETDMLVDFLVIHQHWEPSYVRQRMLPMLSTIYLRDTAERTAKSLLNGQFEFDCIQRIKIRSGHQSFVVKWRRAGSKQTDAHQHEEQDEIIEIDEISDGLDDEWEEPAMIHVDHEGQFVSTDENMELVRAAFPDQVKEFLLAKELKESKRKRPKSGVASDKSKGVQLTITEFYRSNKAQVSDKQGEASKPSPDEEDKEIQTTSTSPLSKSARRRLLFDKCRIADL